MDNAAVLADAVATLSRYVQFDTTNPPGKEMPAALWLRDQITRRGISSNVTVHEPVSGRGLVIARIPGSESLRPLMLNHHIDVVGADPNRWVHPPFGGDVADGFVWGRGTLDTKSLGIIFLLALEELIKKRVKFRRPIIFTAVPDEEPGGDKGMRWLVENHAAEINPEWVWDEGSGGLKGAFGKKVMFAVAVAEKQIYRVRLIATGEPGHGSMPHHNSANLTLLAALQRIANTPRPMHVDAAAQAMFRALAETQTFPASFFLRNLSCWPALSLAGGKLAADKFTNAALRDTVCINVINGGYQINVIPEQAEAQLDCRLLPGTDAAEFGRWLNKRIADDRIKVEMIQSSPPSGIAPLDGLFYQTVCQVVANHYPGAGVFPLLMTGATDGRYWRMSGYAAYGFAPIILERGDVNRVHGIDERISADNLLLGISMTQDIIQRLCA